MSKVILAIFVIGFWLFLPIPMMMFGVSGFEEVSLVTIQNAQNPGETGFLNFLASVGQLVSIYFQLFFFSIAGINFIILRFINMLQIMSVIFVIIMLRGN